MSLLRRSFLRDRAPLGADVRGISLLDLILAVLVLTVVLLAAAKQFSRYEPAPAPVPAEPAAGEPEAG